MTFVTPQEFRELLDSILGKPIIQALLTLPPTSNNIYFTKMHQGRTMRILTSEARTWKTRAVKELVRQSRLAFQKEFDPHGLYWLCLHFRFDEIINKGWDQFFVRGKNAGKRKAASRWRKTDNDNRVKLASDALKNVTGVDDSSNFTHVLLKDVDRENPGMEIVLWQLEDIYA